MANRFGKDPQASRHGKCQPMCRSVRLGRPRPIVDCAWDEARKGRRLRRLRRLAKDLGPDEVLVYLDEVDIHLNPKIGPDWMLPGQQKPARTPGQNRRRYLARALDSRSGRLTWVEGPRKTRSRRICSMPPRSLPYITSRRCFGRITTWYLQSHLTWARLCQYFVGIELSEKFAALARLRLAAAGS